MKKERKKRTDLKKVSSRSAPFIFIYYFYSYLKIGHQIFDFITFPFDKKTIKKKVKLKETEKKLSQKV